MKSQRRKRWYMFLMIIFMLCYNIAAYPLTIVPTDDDLRKIAIEKGFLPENMTEADKEIAIKEGNTTILWLALERKHKEATITQLIKMFDEESGVKIKRSPAYYVDEINGVLYNSIKKGDMGPFERKGIGNIFKYIAAMDNDYEETGEKH